MMFVIGQVFFCVAIAGMLIWQLSRPRKELAQMKTQLEQLQTRLVQLEYLFSEKNGKTAKTMWD